MFQGCRQPLLALVVAAEARWRSLAGVRILHQEGPVQEAFRSTMGPSMALRLLVLSLLLLNAVHAQDGGEGGDGGGDGEEEGKKTI